MLNVSMHSLRRLSVCLSTFALLSLSGVAHAWGAYGHHYTNGLAIDCLPQELKPLYMANRAWVVKHAMDPDDYWRSQSRLEGPHHFIDLDTWGDEAANNFPQDYWTACGLYGQEAVDKNGVVPWRIGLFYGRLVKAFQQRDAKAIVENSTWLGHYTADVHVPFHAVKNYDGQLSDQKGIHARFESTMVERQIKEQDMHPKGAVRISNPVASAFKWARASMDLCPAILKADKAAAAKDPAYGDTYYAEFGETARSIALRRLDEGGHHLASLWYSAWLEAGKPALPEALDVHPGESLDTPTHDPNLASTANGVAPPGPQAK